MIFVLYDIPYDAYDRFNLPLCILIQIDSVCRPFTVFIFDRIEKNGAITQSCRYKIHNLSEKIAACNIRELCQLVKKNTFRQSSLLQYPT